MNLNKIEDILNIVVLLLEIVALVLVVKWLWV